MFNIAGLNGYTPLDDNNPTDPLADNGDTLSNRLQNGPDSPTNAPALGSGDSNLIDFSGDSSGLGGMLGALGGLGGDNSTSTQSQQDPELNPGPDGWKSLEQNQVGDCYFLSSLRDVAKNDPSAISKLITADPDGGYTVKFHGMDPVNVDGKGVPEGVTANGKWAQILEQAWEKQRGDTYDGKTNDPGGYGSSDALHALTGQQYGEKSGGFFSGKLDSGLTKQIAQDVGKGEDVTASTSGKPPDDLVGDHVYSVIATDKKGDLEIANPWGTNAQGKGNGEQWLTQKQFTKDFDDASLPGNSDFKGTVEHAAFTAKIETEHAIRDGYHDVTGALGDAKNAVVSATKDTGNVIKSGAQDVVHDAGSVVSGGVKEGKSLFKDVTSLF